MWKERWAEMRKADYNWRFPPDAGRGGKREVRAILDDPDLNWPAANMSKGCCRTGEFVVVRHGKVRFEAETRGTEWYVHALPHSYV